MHLSAETLQRLAGLIKQWCGLALGPDKAYLVQHRLAPVVRSCGFQGFEDLLLRLQARGATRLQEAVVEAITTKETSFFRDPWLFDALLHKVLPELASGLKRGAGRHRIRIWSAGTSTGQEAYSLAMLVRQLIDTSRRAIDEHQFHILATDISAEAIEVARTGIYSKLEVDRGLSESHLRHHLVRHGDGWIVSESLRRLVQFRLFNLLDSPGDLGMFDLVLCRNVLIYFDEPTRERVGRSVHGVLRDGGWLALGSAESLGGIRRGIQSVKLGRAVVYHKSDSGTLIS
jgi:chemotaxis protein methyltransferase CheR